nr:DUF3488 domain-containing transglutaminase family protein [Oceanococcus sp. HetDA_MAG_MS8]
MSAETQDWLSAPRVTRIVLLLGLLSLPHLFDMPLWCIPVVVAAAAWRIIIARRALRLPSIGLRLPLAGAVVVGLVLDYGTVNGLEPGSSLLVAMAAMKLLETRTRRDCRLLVYLGYLLLLSQLLAHQDLVWLMWLIAGVVLTTAALLDLQHPQALLPLRSNLKVGGTLALKALPLMLLLFVLFPRIPGPLWGLPQDSHARSGLSDTLQFGSISKLSQSDAVAFRVRFDNPEQLPARRDRYWRGPVLDEFDGYRWTSRPENHSLPRPEIVARGPSVNYEIQLEAHGRSFVPALETPLAPYPRDLSLASDYVLQSRNAIMDARLVRLRSATQSIRQADLVSWRQRLMTRLDAEQNPRTQALVASWKQQNRQPEGVIEAALQYFSQAPFRYTLEPPLLRGGDRVDAFVFETQAGFCEHYAASFVVMMRMAGIPARIVTGYQGGEINGDYLIVRQSDAHAWAEVWQPQRGWIRIDPTAAIAPERIEYGLGAALGDSDLLPRLARSQVGDRDWVARWQLAWDRVEAGWNRSILAYGPELQRQFLRRFGMDDLQTMLYALIACVALFTAMLLAQMTRAHRRRPPADPLVQVRTALFSRAGLDYNPQRGGPLQMEADLKQAGVWDAEAQRIMQHYTRARYAGGGSLLPEHTRALLKAAKQWSPKRDSTQ